MIIAVPEFSSQLAAYDLTYTRLSLSCLVAAALQAHLILSCQSMLCFLAPQAQALHVA